MPVICFDHFGVGDVIDETCGRKVPVTNPRDAVRRLAGAIEDLSRHPSTLAELSSGAGNKASELSWSKNGQDVGLLSSGPGVNLVATRSRLDGYSFLPAHFHDYAIFEPLRVGKR